MAGRFSSFKGPKVVSLFAGAGGLDLGLIQAGLDVVWANDIDPDAVATYGKNIGQHIVAGSITDIGKYQLAQGSWVESSGRLGMRRREHGTPCCSPRELSSLEVELGPRAI